MAPRHATRRVGMVGGLLREVAEHRGTAPTIFRHPVWNVPCVVHGDDFTIVGPEKCLKDVEAAC